MHLMRENAGELEMTKSTLFWQLRANYTQKKYSTPQPVTMYIFIVCLNVRSKTVQKFMTQMKQKSKGEHRFK